MKAELILIESIKRAFPERKGLTDEQIEGNPYLFEQIPASEALQYLPTYMIFILQELRGNPGSLVYLQVLYVLNNYSKCKSADDQSQGVWFLLSTQQKKSIMNFISHLSHNQPENIDADELKKISNRWQPVT
ncbi:MULTISPECIES: hypothetical protein [unclassified Pseudomonas]|uniref:hypothetical protein n=1 Tax=unclassified Pseudomonas TaxID=196821 RepID=UPI0024485594|nr:MULTISPECIES: hypothetical protein [unclassified Pseudomonas]MDG9924238.1 hypothetical protein [Pseudomonas sp. GD04045]MDH0036668.1 hypothetical protein [Pseudomonas sp. GD04019]